MAPRKLRIWIAILVFLLSVALLVASLTPAPRERQSVPMPPVALPTPEALFLPDGFTPLIWEGYL